MAQQFRDARCTTAIFELPKMTEMGRRGQEARYPAVGRDVESRVAEAEDAAAKDAEAVFDPVGEPSTDCREGGCGVC
jgi:hypothetical protein